jgi:PEGA domain
MTRKVKMAALTMSMLLALAPSLAAYPRVIVRPSFGYYGYFGPRYYWPRTVRVVPAPLTGELKIDTRSKNAMVYIDGGYLGLVRKLKSFDLRTGNHEIELRDAGGNVLFHEMVAIVPGRTTRIDAMGIAG